MGIYPRLFIPIFLIMTVAVSVRYSLLIHSETANIEARYQFKAKQLCDYLGSTLGPLSDTPDQDTARRILRGAMELNPDLAAIEWRGRQPRLQFSRAAAAAQYPAWFGHLAGLGNLTMALAIPQARGGSGRLTLSFRPTVPMNRVWRTVSRQAMVSAVNIVLVYILLALILASYEKSLQRLRQAADRFQHGDHNARMAARGTREARLLASTFNRMASEVQTLVRSLRSSQKKLGDQLAQTRQMQTALQHMSWQNFHDVLTGLPNRAALTARFEQDLFLARERNAALAVCLFDLDHFQQINDLHGAQAGDDVLKQVADRLHRYAGGRHYSARLGGDEFVILLTDLDNHDDVERSVARLLAELSAPYEHGAHQPQPLPMSVSAGVAVYSGNALSADTLLRHADQALYQAKLTGRGRYHFFDAHLDAEVRTHHNQRSAIRDALLAGQFRLHYQPKVDMRRGHVVGMEALLRWQHPERGTIGPIQFLPLVDHTDLIIDIGEWVLRQALRQLQAWTAAGHDWAVSVNIAARHFQRGDFVARLSEILAEFPGAPAQRLELEILETSALGDIEHVRRVIMACQALGISFALDDFGTGYSSLSYLKRLPANVLKIDQSFVRNMLADQDDLHLVGAVIGLARSFKMAVIAEGVETVEHGTLLMRLGCDLAQGYGIARPMVSEAVLPWASAFKPALAWQSAALEWQAALH